MICYIFLLSTVPVLLYYYTSSIYFAVYVDKQTNIQSQSQIVTFSYMIYLFLFFGATIWIFLPTD